MGYLSILDYKRTIQEQNLQQIISEDDSIRIDSELTAIEEITSYLIQKYNVTEEFKDISIYSLTDTYTAGQTIILSGAPYNNQITYSANDIISLSGDVYYTSGTTTSESPLTASTWSKIGKINTFYNTKLPANRYMNGKSYKVGDIVYWEGKTYTNIKPNNSIFPDDIDLGSQYWGLGVDYIVSGGTLPTDILYFNLGDGRSKQMVQKVMDITLYYIHSRVAPRNIPDLRVKAYDDSIKWLKGCLMGDITPNLLTKTPRSGSRIRINSNPKQITSY